jgi:hypothetical protein
MHRAVVFAAAAAASFIGTMLYLHQNQHRAGHPAAPVPTQVRDSATEPASGVGTPRPRRTIAPIQPVEFAAVPVEDPDAEERRRLSEYAGGISNVAPVSAEQQRALLDALLRHKHTYEIAVRDAGIDRETLSDAEREYAHRLIARALRNYRDDFLVDARAILTEQQYELLVNYENTEFRRQLDTLQIAINSK